MNDEIISRCLNPASVTDPPQGHYEGRYALDILALRDQPEDFGSLIEYWRAKRDVSRTWLAKELGISVGKLGAIETAQFLLSTQEQDHINETLAYLDWDYPHLQERASHREARVRDRELTSRELDDLDINEEIEWMNPNGWCI